MTTSSLIAYAINSGNFTWDSITGFLYTSGGLTLFVVMTIIFAVIGVGIMLLKRVFGMAKR
jgi:hypothetical protein